MWNNGELDTRREWTTYFVMCLVLTPVALALTLLGGSFDTDVAVMIVGVNLAANLVIGVIERIRRKPDERLARPTWPWWATVVTQGFAVLVMLVAEHAGYPVQPAGAGMLLLCAAGLLRSWLAYRNRLWE